MGFQSVRRLYRLCIQSVSSLNWISMSSGSKSLPMLRWHHRVWISIFNLNWNMDFEKKKKKEIILTSIRLKIVYGTYCFFICLIYLAFFMKLHNKCSRLLDKPLVEFKWSRLQFAAGEDAFSKPILYSLPLSKPPNAHLKVFSWSWVGTSRVWSWWKRCEKNVAVGVATGNIVLRGGKKNCSRVRSTTLNFI